MERSSYRSTFTENSSNSSCENILKIVEQPPNQIKTKTYKYLTESSEIQKSSSMSLNTLPNAPQSSSAATAQRKKRLQRQKSIVYSGDETEYAADLEEEEDDEEDEGYGHNERETNLNLAGLSNMTTISQKKKQIRFRNKQQSESSLKLINQHAPPIEKTYSSSSLTSSLNSSNTTSSGGSHERRFKSDGSFDSLPELPHHLMGGGKLQRQNCILKRDNSIHSDSSRYSSVDSLLEARKPDPEAILINLGFGPVGSEDILSRIPKRFLKPSQVRGIDTEAFIKRLQLANTLADHSVLGYRGLTGNPDVPPSHIVAKIMERFEVNERKKSTHLF